MVPESCLDMLAPSGERQETGLYSGGALILGEISGAILSHFCQSGI